MPAQTARRARNYALAALLISLAANIGIAHQAHRNCRAIENLRSAIHSTLDESYQRLISGALDDDYKRIYGDRWIAKKREAISTITKQEERFKQRTCSFIFQ